MELEVYTKQGIASGRKIKVSKKVLGVDINEHAVYLAVQAYMTNNRQGTASTKTRSIVSGGGRKPWKQKGRGTSRSGTNRSPIWRGGGIVHGPLPHPYNFKLPNKVNRLARLSALSVKYKDEQLKVVEDFSLENAKTREIYTVLKNFGVEDTKTLVLLPEYDLNMLIASRNIKNLKILMAKDASVYDLLDCKALLVMESAVKKLGGVK